MIAPSNAPRPQLWILRHGETEWSKSGQYTGLTDLPLTVEGEQQSVEARKVLDAVDFDLVLTSPLRRARRTAELAGFPDAQLEPLAVEWDYGDYEGISSDLIRKDNPEYLIWTHGVPNGEALDDVAARADKIVARVLESGLDNVLIVRPRTLLPDPHRPVAGARSPRGPALHPGHREGLHARLG